MSKNDWFDLIQTVGTFAILFMGKNVSKAKHIIDDYDKLKERVTTIENSQAAAWKKIDKKEVPHGGEI